jgi:hypothetical protein
MKSHGTGHCSRIFHISRPAGNFIMADGLRDGSEGWHREVGIPVAEIW